jgi:nucleoside phosphorylase
MLGIVFATRTEADPFLSKTFAVPLASHPFAVYQSGGTTHVPCITVISGMGKVAAAIAASYLVLAQKVSMLVNAGLCGRLVTDNRWPVGELFRIGTAIEGDCDRFGQAERGVPCDTGWFSGLKTARLVTNDRPVFDAAWRRRLAGFGDLADMEGAAVVRVARLYGISCAMVKGISDSADKSGRQDVASHMAWVSRSIADVLVQEFSKHPGAKQP